MNDGITQSVEKYLDQLSEARARLDVLKVDLKSKREWLVPDDVKAAWLDLEMEYLPQIEAAEKAAGDIDNVIRECTTQLRQSVKSASGVQAVYSERTTWDTKGLEGYAVAHPEVLHFRKVSPSISIRG